MIKMKRNKLINQLSNLFNNRMLNLIEMKIKIKWIKKNNLIPTKLQDYINKRLNI